MMCHPEPRVSSDQITLVWEGIDHAEGLAIAPDGTVWCGGEEGQIYRGLLAGEPRQVATLPGRTLGFALDAEGNAYCATISEAGIFRVTPAGLVALVSTGSAECRATLPNHPAFLPSGVLLFTDSGTWGQDDGLTFSVTPDGTTTVADRTCSRFPNGLVAAPGGETVLVVESTLPGVSALSVDVDGTLHDRRVIVEMPGTVPDGVALDASGRILISCWSPDAVFMFDGSELTVVAHDPLRYVLHEPTNLAFVPETRTIVTANYGERFLSVFEHDTPGASLPRPAFGWAG
jgi:gluconolactonase